MDGYHILVDLLGTPTLAYDSVRFVRESLWSRIKTLTGLNRQEVLWVAYFALSLGSITGFIALNVWVIVHASHS